MQAEAESAASLVDALSGCHNVLLLTPTLVPDDGAACAALLSVAPPAEANVLCVTFSQSPDRRLARWRSAGGPTAPANLGFIVVGDRFRSATSDRLAAAGASNGDLAPMVASVSSPGDLTGLGIEVGNVFADWIDDGGRILLCFHTVTTFLQYADLRTGFRFLHLLTGRVRSAGGTAHYHLDPTAHDRRTVDTLRGLFDGVVERRVDGTWTVDRRR